MGHLVRPVVFRAREDGRQSRLPWLLVIAAFNLLLWSGLIFLVARMA